MNKNNIADIYPLSPMQQGMLFHTVYDPKSGMYCEQMSCTIQGNLNVNLFRRAWQQVLDRHPILRTSFIWEGIKEPVQVVNRQVTLPWQEYDWQGVSGSEQQEKLEFFLQADQQQDFELKQAPLMRLTLIHLSVDSYYFVWTHHHILLDGWSTPILLQEVFSVYAALCRGDNLSLPLPRPYRDYIVWLQQQNLADAEAFWRENLEGFATPTSVKISRNVLNLTSNQESYGEEEIKLSETTTTNLQSLAKQHQLTLNTLVQGAWSLLLSHYSSEDDIVFGSAVSGRPPNLAGADAMVGLFINTLPVRVQIGDKDTLLSWLKQLQAQQVEARQYEYAPLVEIQKWSEVPRGLPLFESLVVFENYPLESSLQEGLQNLEIKNIRAFEKTNYPLTVIAAPGTELSLKILYDTQRFDADAIARMLGHFQTLLESMVASCHQTLSQLPMLTAAERQQILAEFNQNSKSKTAFCIHQLFEAQAERTPDAVAFINENVEKRHIASLTYRQLNERANQLAHYLQKLDIKPETLVGICLERSIDTVVAILAILKAGGAYVPLDPAYPQERLAFMLADSQIKVLLTQEQFLNILPQHSAKVVCLEKEWQGIQSQNYSENLVTLTNPDNLAYVIYTSGSTGTPKGVLATHRGAVNRLTWNPYPFATDEVCCQKTSLNFVDSVWEIFAPLIHGIATVIIPDAIVKDAEKLVQTLSEHHVTRLVLVPSLLRVILDTCTDLDNKLPTLKYWVSSGEALTVELVQQFKQQLPNRILLNLYGSSEVAADATWHNTNASEFTDCVPIGRPIANTQVYILNRHLQPVPIGVQGEIYIGGENLARGYLNRPDLTAEKFIDNPFDGYCLTSPATLQGELSQVRPFPTSEEELGGLDLSESKSLYRTGDLGCYLANGEIEYLGRLDHQVKIRGFRIATGEIESVIKQHPDIEECIVIVREDLPGDKRLVAYIIANVETITFASLREVLQGKLSDYMMPSAFVVLESFPLNPNGKVDRLALPAPDTYRSDQETTFVPPQTEIEEEIAEIWIEILGIEKVGINDSFFYLGGHSLMATQLISRVRKKFDIDLALPDFFQSPTIKDLAELVETAIFLKADATKIEELLLRMEAVKESVASD
ncbi:MAG TPA: amino acid adenylation domain-containing protein [Candidatus Obscuribacterales bacterium]